MTWLPKSVVCLTYYDRSRFRSDALAALLLSLQIFPLAIAIGIAVGVHPLYGISCAAVAGFLTSIFGDSKIRVSAPNVIFVAVASSIVAREGILGLSLSTFLAGVLLMVFGAMRFGAAIQLLPRPVALGFTTGLVVLVVGEQLPGVLGLGSQTTADHTGRGALAVVRHARHIDSHAIILALLALLTMGVCRRMRTLRHVPTGLVIVATGAFLVRFGHLPVRTVEVFQLSQPILLLHPGEVLRLNPFGRILAQAFAIAVWIALESLQALRVATSLTGERSNPDGELFVQGGTNLASAWVGGLPVSGVSSHTLENVRLGAQTPVAGILHAFFLVLFLVLAAPVVQFIPFPVISALILSSVFSMVTWQEIRRLAKAPRLEAVTWVVTSLLTIFADLPVAIAVGMLIGMFLYIRKEPSILSKGAAGRLPWPNSLLKH